MHPALMFYEIKQVPICVKIKKSDVGSQYRCGRVGRGSQLLSTPNSPPNPDNTDTYTKSFLNARLASQMRISALFYSYITDRRISIGPSVCDL